VPDLAGGTEGSLDCGGILARNDWPRWNRSGRAHHWLAIPRGPEFGRGGQHRPHPRLAARWTGRFP